MRGSDLFSIFRFNRLLGQVDHISHRVIRGWAWDPHKPLERILLEVFFNDVFLGQALAGAFRPDLARSGIGDGRHGFIFHIPAEVPDHFVASDILVTSIGPQRAPLRLSSSLAFPPVRHKIKSDPLYVFGPFLKTLQTTPPEECNMNGSMDAPLIDAVLSDDADLGASAFIVHVARKYGQPIDKNDWNGLMRWYIESYATERGPKLAPFSRTDIFRLNTEVSSGLTVAMALAGFEAPVDKVKLFAWVQEAHRCFVEDCLVTPSQQALLRAVDEDQSRVTFPLSAFMAQAQKKWAVLRNFQLNREQDRQAIYVIILIVALRRSAICSYIPSEWWTRLSTSTTLGKVLQDLFGSSTEGACRILRDFETGDSQNNQSEIPSIQPDKSFVSHRILRQHLACLGPPEVDVQVIGPFRRRMGLGEACRRLAHALAHTQLSVNLVDYEVGNASRDIESDFALGRPCSARLNILHLNLEEIPEALVYLPNIFEGTPTVAVPFWELNRPAAVHSLGLSIVDGIWVSSHFLEGVFEDAGKPVHWIGMSCDESPAPSDYCCAALRQRYGLRPSTFAFLTTSDALSWVQRKNPLGVVLAFQAAFVDEQDVSLIVKTHNLDGPLSVEQHIYWKKIREICALDRRILFIEDSLDAPTQRTMLKAVDCLVSLHRSEGLGLDPLDALWLGTPVVATDYSGVTDFCTAETAWMVDAARVAVNQRDYSFVEPGHVWATPSHESAVACLRDVFENSELRARRIEAGRRVVAQTASTVTFAERLRKRIEYWIAPASYNLSRVALRDD